MDITQIRYFLKTAELLNYSRAAEQLFIARQSLRQSIAALEKELGLPLFNNEHNRLSLTQYGAYLAVSGAEAVQAFDNMLAGFERFANRQTQLRVGFSVSLFPFILPYTTSALRPFEEKYPNIRLEVTHLTNDEAIDAVEAGQLDCACIIRMACADQPPLQHTLVTFDAGVDFADDSPLAGRAVVQLRDLMGIRCIGMGSLEKTLRPVHQACLAQDVTLNYAPIHSTVDAFYQIQHGLAAAFDIYRPDAPGFDPRRTARLTGYLWEVGFLGSKACADREAVKIFCDFWQHYAAGQRPD